jgi:hypothetical protein
MQQLNIAEENYYVTTKLLEETYKLFEQEKLEIFFQLFL